MTAERRRDTPPLPEPIESVYIVGVCGTAMGSLAAMLVEQGLRVLGSDRAAYPPMSTWLEARGIEILPGWDGDNLRRLQLRPDLVVVGNVCRPDNPEVAAARELGVPCLSLPEVLRERFLVRAERRIAVSGTHGKTTTSSMVAWLLESAGRKPSFMIGGITGNFGSNYKLDDGPEFVIEGDEYDTAFFDKVPKFWHYEPDVLVVTNLEFDHADIYDTLEDIVGVFAKLIEGMDAQGTVWANLDDDNTRRLVWQCDTAATVRGFSVQGPSPPHKGGMSAQPTGGPGMSAKRTGGAAAGEPELLARDVQLVPGAGVSFEVVHHGEVLGRIELSVPGLYNVYNALAATAVGLGLGLEFSQIAEALEAFRAVRKRQELVGVVDQISVYDDFAHHPTAVRETVTAIATRHPDARLWGVFEAKSNTSRRAVFQDAYVDALVDCDRVLLSAPWRKDDDLPPEKLIDLDAVVQGLRDRGTDARRFPGVDEIVAVLADELEPGDVVLGMSGSAFGGLHHKVLDALRARHTDS